MRTSSCLAVFALRTRVSMSAIGSVIMMWVSSPARLRQAGDLAGVGELAQAHTAEAELAVDRTGPAAAAAAGVAANLELRLRVGLVDQCFLCHLSRLSSLLLAAVARATVLLLAGLVLGVGALLEGEAERIEQSLATVVVVRRGDDGDVHATRVIGLVRVDLGEHGLLVEPEGVVAVSVPRVSRQAPEIADTGDRNRDQTVEELPHPVTTQRHLDADGLPLAQLEVGDRGAGLGDDRLLAGDHGEIGDTSLDQRGLTGGASHAHVDDDLVEAGHLHHVLDVQIALQRRLDLVVVARLETRHGGFHGGGAHPMISPLGRATRTFVPSSRVW